MLFEWATGCTKNIWLPTGLLSDDDTNDMWKISVTVFYPYHSRTIIALDRWCITWWQEAAPLSLSLGCILKVERIRWDGNSSSLPLAITNAARQIFAQPYQQHQHRHVPLSNAWQSSTWILHCDVRDCVNIFMYGYRCHGHIAPSTLYIFEWNRFWASRVKIYSWECGNSHFVPYQVPCVVAGAVCCKGRLRWHVVWSSHPFCVCLCVSYFQSTQQKVKWEIPFHAILLLYN